MKLVIYFSCPVCGSLDFTGNKHTFSDNQWYQCKSCGWMVGIVNTVPKSELKRMVGGKAR